MTKSLNCWQLILGDLGSQYMERGTAVENEGKKSGHLWTVTKLAKVKALSMVVLIATLIEHCPNWNLELISGHTLMQF